MNVYSLIPFLLISFLFALPVFSQQSSNDIRVSVAIIENESTQVITIRQPDFSDFSLSEGVFDINPVEDERSGKMIITGTPNAMFRISYLQNRSLLNTQSNNVLAFVYQIAGNSIDEQQTAELFEEEMRELRFNENGEFYIWVGGSVFVDDAASPGIYMGDFTIEIDYI